MKDLIQTQKEWLDNKFYQMLGQGGLFLAELADRQENSQADPQNQLRCTLYEGGSLDLLSCLVSQPQYLRFHPHPPKSVKAIPRNKERERAAPQCANFQPCFNKVPGKTSSLSMDSLASCLVKCTLWFIQKCSVLICFFPINETEYIQYS